MNFSHKKSKNMPKPENSTEKKPATNSSGSAEEAAKAKELRKLEWQKKLSEKNLENKKETAGGGEMSKAQLKIQRREQQEAQRLAKIQQKVQEKKVKKETQTDDTSKKISKIEDKPIEKKIVKSVAKPPRVNRMELFNHLYPSSIPRPEYESSLVNIENIHPIFVRLGVQYKSRQIFGSNARCLALLSAVKKLLKDVETPPNQEFSRYFQSVLTTHIEYLKYCRQFSVSMTNSLRHFKIKLTQKASKLSDDDDKKLYLKNCIDSYITDEIYKAAETISSRVKSKITQDDVILTYGCSSLIKKILLDAHKHTKGFQVIIVDSRIYMEGRQLLQTLVSVGINCTYIPMSAVSYVMCIVTKVLVGAHALLANGYVMARVGTAQVALVAKSYNKSVLVCCETYKFTERVQTDSFVHNEIGDPDMLAVIETAEQPSPLVNWRNNPNLTLLNLLYDITPPDLVSGVVTELSLVPCTSVPVVLRIRPIEAI